MKTVAVVGAGIAGRCCALALARTGCTVTVFERGSLSGREGVSHVAAGILAPLSEAAAHGAGERWFYELARDAVERWKALIASLPGGVFMTDSGSLIAARAADGAELDEVRERFARLDPEAATRLLGSEELRALEPDLAPALTHGLLVAGEGAVHGAEAMDALAAALYNEAAVRERQPVADVAPHRVDGVGFDWVVDCRGLAARDDLRDLRGVRGELVEIHAPALRIGRPTRVPHPRYPIYVVPRGQGTYVVGATALESEDEGPPSVTALLELLGAVYGLSPGFRLAGVTRVAAGLRPAFFDNLPKVAVRPGLLRVNGLYRHGFMLAPAVAAAVAAYVRDSERLPAGPLFQTAEGAA